MNFEKIHGATYGPKQMDVVIGLVCAHFNMRFLDHLCIYIFFEWCPRIQLKSFRYLPVRISQFSSDIHEKAEDSTETVLIEATKACLVRVRVRILADITFVR